MNNFDIESFVHLLHQRFVIIFADMLCIVKLKFTAFYFDQILFTIVNSETRSAFLIYDVLQNQNFRYNATLRRVEKVSSHAIVFQHLSIFHGVVCPSFVVRQILLSHSLDPTAPCILHRRFCRYHISFYT